MPNYYIDGDGFLIETYHQFAVYNFKRKALQPNTLCLQYIIYNAIRTDKEQSIFFDTLSWYTLSMNKTNLIGAFIIAVSILLSTISYLYFNPQATCERNYFKEITYGTTWNSKESKEKATLKAKLFAYEYCSGI